MKKDINLSPDEKFNNEMHRLGRIWSIIAIVLMLLVPFAMSIIFNAKPNLTVMLLGSLGICIIYLPSSIIEVITYSPMLGTGRNYLAFITGNLVNLKIPCVMNSQEIVGTKFGTKENEIVSIISVAVSAIVTCVVLIIGVILMVPLTPELQSPVLQPAFNMVVPALFGALGYQYFSKNPKLVIAPLLTISIVSFLFPQIASQVAILVPISALISMGVGRILYNKKII